MCRGMLVEIPVLFSTFPSQRCPTTVVWDSKVNLKVLWGRSEHRRRYTALVCVRVCHMCSFSQVLILQILELHTKIYTNLHEREIRLNMPSSDSCVCSSFCSLSCCLLLVVRKPVFKLSLTCFFCFCSKSSTSIFARLAAIRIARL